jgi:hypothetical protein
MLLVTPQPGDDRKDVPETDEEHEGHSCNSAPALAEVVISVRTT